MPPLSLPLPPDSMEEVAFALLLILLAALVFGVQYWQHRRIESKPTSSQTRIQRNADKINL